MTMTDSSKSLIRSYENALENVKSALNSGMDKNDILHTIGDEVSWALSQREVKRCETSLIEKLKGVRNGIFYWMTRNAHTPEGAGQVLGQVKESLTEIIRQHEAEQRTGSAIGRSLPNVLQTANQLISSEIRDNKLPLDADVAEIVCSKIEQGRYGANPSQYLIANVAAQYAIAFMSEREPVSVSLNKAYEKYLDAYSEVVNRDDSSCADAELAGVKAVLYYARIDYVD